MIHPKDISFVVQGPIHHDGPLSTRLVLNSIRREFPESTILLSTWENENVSELEYDTLIVQPTPEAFSTLYAEQCNVNRLLLSTQKGLEKVKTPFAVKTRTDIVFTNNNLLQVQKEENATLFTNKILLLNYFSRNPYRQYVNHGDGFLFHPSDIFLLGTTADLKKYFSAKPTDAKTLNNNSGNAPIFPEQYLLMSLLVQEGYLTDFYHSRLKSNPTFAKLSESVFKENFAIGTPNQIGIEIPERMYTGWRADSIYTDKDLLGSNYFNGLKAIYYCKIYPIFVKIKKRTNGKN